MNTNTGANVYLYLAVYKLVYLTLQHPQLIMIIGPSVFAEIGDCIFSKAHGLCRTVRSRRFSALFGATPTVCAIAWSRIQPSAPVHSHPKHLMWALLFLKLYATEHVNSALVGVDEKTWRKWIWTIVPIISNFKVVCTLHILYFQLLIFVDWLGEAPRWNLDWGMLRKCRWNWLQDIGTKSI